jgi:hypothetical protein
MLFVDTSAFLSMLGCPGSVASGTCLTMKLLQALAGSGRFGRGEWGWRWLGPGCFFICPAQIAPTGILACNLMQRLGVLATRLRVAGQQ